MFFKKKRSNQQKMDVAQAAKLLLQNEVLTEGVARVQEKLLQKFQNANLTNQSELIQIQADRKAFDNLLIELATIAKEGELIQAQLEQQNQ